MLVDVGDTRLHVTERGAGELALFVLHGGPGPRPHDVRLLPRRAGRRAAGCCSSTSAAPGRSEPAPPETWTLDASRRRRRGAGRRARARALRGPRPLLRGVHRAAARGRLPGPPGRDDRLQRRPRRALPRARRGASSPPSSPSSCASRCSASWAREAARAHAGGRRARCSPTSCRSTSPTRATRASTTCAPPWATRSTAPDVLRARRDRGLRRDRRRGPPGRGRATRCSCSPGATTAPARWRPPRRWRPGCPTPSSSSSSTAATWPSSRRTTPTSPRCATSSSAARAG